MTKRDYGRVYAQERNGEPFTVDVELIEDNWDFRRSCYQQYELNVWGKKITGEKNLILSRSVNRTFSLESDAVNNFIKDVGVVVSKEHCRMLTKREYDLKYKAFYQD